MVLTWKRSVLPVVAISALIVFEEWVALPSCKIVPGTGSDEQVGGEKEMQDDLKVMLVANLLLLGSDSGFVNLYFRDYYMSKFFKKSFYSVKPDMLLILGDFSAKGSELTRSKWLSVFHQLHQMLGPLASLPFHVILGDRDVGECHELDAKSVNWIARRFPGLDSAGCGAFEISNISFISLNAVALLCGNNELRFGVEKVIERESAELQKETETVSKANHKTEKLREMTQNFQWRENAMSSGSGPVLLLHFPLHRTAEDSCKERSAFFRAVSPSHCSSNMIHSRGFSDTGPYELLHTVPPNATEYIFQALRPGIIFSAHTHEFYDHTHSDGTREVTVPAVTWRARNDPGFVVATFKGNRSVVSISYCSLARESHILMAYSSFLAILIVSMLVANPPRLRCLGQ